MRLSKRQVSRHAQSRQHEHGVPLLYPRNLLGLGPDVHNKVQFERAVRGSSAFRRGSALMEVVISLSILVVAMGVIGFAFRNGQLSLERSERITWAMLLTDQILTNIDLGIITVTGDAETSLGQGNLTSASGLFGEDAPPGMSYRVQAESDITQPGVVRVYVEIFAGEPGAESGHLILATSALRAPPRALDLERDFGLQEEQTQLIQDAIPGGAAFFDPKKFNPRDLASLDMDTLMQLLPALMQAFGGGALMGRMDEIMQAAQSGDVQKLQDIAQQAAPSGTLPDPSMKNPAGPQPGPDGQDQEQPPRPRRQKDR